MAFWGLCCGGGSHTSAAELTREEVVDLFTLSTKVNNGRLIVHGLFARADTKNTNGRIYPKPILRREVRRFKRAHIRCATALGELNHPSYYSAYFCSLNLPNISHQVLEVHWRGSELWGSIEVLPTPAGLLLWELYSRGIKLGVSSRGWASVVADPANDRVLVDDDFQLITFDFVTEPSNAGAYLVPIRTKYRKPLPDQLRAVRAAYLGLGSIGMASLGQLPAASLLSQWLKSTKKAMAAAAAQHSTGGASEQACAVTASTLQQPPAASLACGSGGAPTSSSHACTSAGEPASTAQPLQPRSCVLPAATPLGGGVVLGCHYRALQEPWLPVDPAGREFKVHLSLVATKAHIMQQKQQQRQQGLAPAVAGCPSTKQQQDPQVAQALVALAPPAAAVHMLDTMHSGEFAHMQQQQQQQQQQGIPGSVVEQQPASNIIQQQQQQQQHPQQTRSAVREALFTTSTSCSQASNSNGSQHTGAAHEALLCSAATVMSGCSLGPVVLPPAGHAGETPQHAWQEQQVQQVHQHQHQQGQQQVQQHQQQQVQQQMQQQQQQQQVQQQVQQQQVQQQVQQQGQQQVQQQQVQQQVQQQMQQQQVQQQVQQQQQQQQSSQAQGRPQSAPGLSISSLQLHSWDWDRHTQQAHAAAALPSALQTVQVKCEQRLQAHAYSVSTASAAPAEAVKRANDATTASATCINSPGSDAAAAGIPAAACSTQASTAATAAAGGEAFVAAAGTVSAAVLLSSGKVPGAGPDSRSMQLRSPGPPAAVAAAAAEGKVQDSARRGSNVSSAKPMLVAAWPDACAQQQHVAQQQSPDDAAVAVAAAAGEMQLQQQGCTLDEEYLEIRDTLQRYQVEYRRQRQHIRQRAGSTH